VNDSKIDGMMKAPTKMLNRWDFEISRRNSKGMERKER